MTDHWPAVDRAAPHRPSVQFHLLGTLDYSRADALERRLAAEAATERDAPIRVLLCEHRPLITVGRRGSRRHIRRTDEQLRRARIQTRWVDRDGGCVPHAEGQLAVVPIVSLRRQRWSVDEYQHRLRDALAAALAELRIRACVVPGDHGLWGRSGQLVNLGVAVREGVTCRGAVINVNPSMDWFRHVDVAERSHLPAGSATTMGCLLAEPGPIAKMTAVRSVLIPHVSDALGAELTHIHSGHPYLRRGDREPFSPAR